MVQATGLLRGQVQSLTCGHMESLTCGHMEKLGAQRLFMCHHVAAGPCSHSLTLASSQRGDSGMSSSSPVVAAPRMEMQKHLHVASWYT
jgi:hypothetical protein